LDNKHTNKKDPQSPKNKEISKEILEAQNNPLHPNPDKILPYGG